MIAQLEKQRSAIDRGIAALREITEAGVTTPSAPARDQKKPKRQLSPEGRNRIISATKRRWEIGRASGREKNNGTPGKSPQAPGTPLGRKVQTKRTMSAAAKRKLSLAAKRRWDRIKKQ